MTDIPEGEQSVDAITPVELKRTSFRTVRRGYDPAQVDALLARVRDGYEQMWRDRLELRIEVHDLRAELAQLAEENSLVKEVLVTAQRTATEVVAEAERRASKQLALAAEDSQRMLEDARAEADGLARELEASAAERSAEIARLEGIEREMKAGYRAFLLAALELLENGTKRLGETPAETGAPAETVEEPAPVHASG